MKTWKRQLADAKTVDGKRSVVERHAKALAVWGGRLTVEERSYLSPERRAEVESQYAAAALEELRKRQQEVAAVERERAEAPFGRCAFSGEPLPDPGTLSPDDAEKLGFAPCMVRYGKWPDGSRVV